MIICPVGAEFFLADVRKDRETRQRVAFRNFANAQKRGTGHRGELRNRGKSLRAIRYPGNSRRISDAHYAVTGYVLGGHADMHPCSNSNDLDYYMCSLP
jgi:hypothetical protein